MQFPAQAAVPAYALTDAVVLDQVLPRDAGSQVEVDIHARYRKVEIALRQFRFNDLIIDGGKELRQRAKLDEAFIFLHGSGPEIAPAIAEFTTQHAPVVGLQPDAIAVEGIVAYRYDNTARYFKRGVENFAHIQVIGLDTVVGLRRQLDDFYDAFFSLEIAVHVFDTRPAPAGVDQAQGGITVIALAQAAIGLEVTDARAIHETQLRIEIRLNFPKEPLQLNPVVRIIKLQAIGHVVITYAGVVGFLHPRIAYQYVAAEQVAVAILKIGTVQPAVVVRVGVTIREDHADAGFAEHARAYAYDRKILRIEFVFAFNMRADNANVKIADAACHLRTKFQVERLTRIDDAHAPREKRNAIFLTEAAELENVGVVQKKVARFGEKQREPPEIVLHLVDRCIRKVRIDRDLRGQRRGHAVDDVAAGHNDLIRISDWPVFAGLHGKRGNDVETQALLHAFEPRHVTKRRDIHIVTILRNVCPAHTFVLAANAPHNFQAPRITAWIERHCLERNHHLEGPAFFVDTGFAVPYAVPLRVPVFVILDARIDQRT